MSKKPQNPQKQVNPKKPQIVDQQNQPFLRTISKRIRNINKKLTEIQDLKKKDDLKPEQTEKVNRKVEYENERNRLEGIADFYREAYAENVESYRNIQLQELDSLANAIAVLRGSANWKDAERLADLNRALTQPSTLSLTESAKSISEVLRRFANDFKLKKSVDTFVAENQVAQQPEQKPAQQPVQPEPVQEVKAEEPKQQAPVVQQTPVVAEKPVQQEVPVQEAVVQATQPTTQEVPAEQKPVEGQTGEQKPVQGGEQRHPRGNNRTRGEYRGPRQPREQREPREPRQYKPRQPREPRAEGQEGQEGGERRRYQPNKQRPNYKPKNQVEGDDSDSSLEREPAMRTFKKEEIRQLEDDGFQVVGKPKPKAKEGQKEWYDKTHGKKAHHHHQAQN